MEIISKKPDIGDDDRFCSICGEDYIDQYEEIYEEMVINNPFAKFLKIEDNFICAECFKKLIFYFLSEYEIEGIGIQLNDIKRRRREEEFLKETIEKRKIKEKEEGFIYLIKCNGIYKVGITQNIKKRFNKYKTENPFEAEIINCALIKGYKLLEQKLLEDLKEYNIRGEWFNLPEEKIKYINEFLKKYEI